MMMIKQKYYLTLTIIASFLIPLKSEAVTLDLTINRVRTDERFIGPLDRPDFLALVDIDNSGPQTRTGPRNNSDISPNWTFSQFIDVRGRDSTDVPIVIDLFDEDPKNDDRLDIDPGGGDALNLVYNLESRTFRGDVSSSPATGTRSDRAASIFFDITSDPINFDFQVQDIVEVIGLDTFRYQYTISNLSNSYDIESFELDFVDPSSTIIPIIQPGESFTLDFLSSALPRSAESRVTFNDPNNTTLPTSVRIPETTPESNTLFGIITIGILVFVTKKRFCNRF